MSPVLCFSYSNLFQSLRLKNLNVFFEIISKSHKDPLQNLKLKAGPMESQTSFQ